MYPTVRARYTAAYRQVPDTGTKYRNNASERPLGRYEIAGVKRRHGAFTVLWPGRFLKENISGLLAPRGDTKKQEKNTHLSHTATYLTIINNTIMFRVDTGDTVVTGVGIADGSRVKI